ncbi:uncharacterized protein LOC119489349 [Sebastes umbrosus]|uniref:uncharacterized protein LOC119489349 n=1 Tax=Sebastes umbrosus TaxID=72105 RepID=UPI0018A1152C|nr:uncharacterized protein LOC119489349 [Sebastes umbrosus]
MTRSCCAVNCSNRTSDGWKMFNIPRGKHPFQQRRRKLWLEAVNRPDWGSGGSCRAESLCSAHFISGEPSMDCDSPDFVPSIFNHNMQKKTTCGAERKDKPEGGRKRKHSGDTEAVQTSSFEFTTTDECDLVPRKQMDALILQYNQLFNKYEALKQELKETQEENGRLKQRRQRATFGFHSIKDEDSRVHFYTGLLSLQVFIWLLNSVKGSAVVLRDELSWEDHLLLVLVKVKHGFTNRYIAEKFGVSFFAASKIVREWIPVLSSILRPLMIWPCRETARASLPKCFKAKYLDCRCVVDCTEILIERTSNLIARAETWSRHKNQNIMKYLIGITPAGAVCFLSDGFGGRVSDKMMASESGFLGKLEHGDVVLADRRFLLREELASVGATLKIPRLTKEKSHRRGDSCRPARVRVRVERVIGRFKTFQILNTVIPLSQIDLLDDIVTLCAGLTHIKACIPVIVKEEMEDT